MPYIYVFASYWLRKPWQLVALIIGLSIATAMWTGVQAINNEAKASYDTAASLLTDGQYDQIVPKRGQSIAQKTYIALRRAGWLVSPLIEGEIGNIRFIGLDWATVPFKSPYTTTQATSDLDNFDLRQRLYVHSETAEQLEFSLPIEIDDTLPLATVIGDVGVIQTILRRSDLSRLLISSSQPMNQIPLNQITNKLIIQSAQQTADLSQLTQSFHMNLTAFSLLSFTVGLFIVYSTVGLTFEQRNGLIQVLRVLGVPLRKVIIILIIEALLIAIVSAVLGILMGYLIAASLLPDVAATLRGLYGAQIPSSLTLQGDWWLSGIGMALFGTTIAFADRIWQLSRTPLLATSRPRLTHAVSTMITQRFAYAAVIFLGFTLLVGTFFEGLLAGFFVLGGLLLTAAFWLPLNFALDVGTAPKNRILGLSVVVSRRYSAPTTITELGSDGAVTCSLNKYWGVNDGLQLPGHFRRLSKPTPSSRTFCRSRECCPKSISNQLPCSNKPGDPATGVYDAATGGKNHRFTRHCCGANLS